MQGFRRPSFTSIALLVASLAIGGCASRVASTKPAATVLTIPELRAMLEKGDPVAVILSKIDSSGTVYRLSTQARADLRASGMPAAILSKMEIMYQHAIGANPDLAKSDE